MALRLLAVHAHPDDESSKGAATYAHYLAQGAEVMIVSCTGGERGDVLNEAVQKDPRSQRDLAGLRRAEMARARDIIGFQHRWLGYADSGLPPEGEPVPPWSFAAIPAEVSAEALVRVVREFKPHVLVSYNEIGGYPHPDHIRTHEITMLAWEKAGDPAAYPAAGEPWTPQKFYYEAIFHAARAERMLSVLREKDPSSGLLEPLAGIVERMRQRPGEHTARVPVGAFFEQRDAALRAHASQVPPDSPFFFWPNDLQREAWPTEDYRLAASRVPVNDFETDLFEGVIA